MPLGDFGSSVSRDATPEELADLVSRLIKEVTYLLNGGLDTLNVNELSADVINAGILNAALVMIKAINGSYSYTFDGTGIKANNGSVDTLKFDLATGLLTIVSALIQSSTGYPRVELNNSTNLLGAYLTANDAIRIVPNYSGGTPALYFYTGGSLVGLFQDFGSSVGLTTPVGVRDIVMSSGKSLFLSANNGIEMTCAGIRINGNIGVSGTVYVSSTPGGPATTPITFTNGIRTS